MKKYNVVAICGSTRNESSNLYLLRAIIALAVDQFNLSIFRDLAGIPHFNPDLDNDQPPAAVAAFRKKLAEADAVMICTPEYAMGVPGSLKNAVDWTVSSMDLSAKPTALITASSSGQKGHAALLETLNVLECRMHTTTQLLIPFIKTKVNREAQITDEQTLVLVKQLIHSLYDLVATSH